MTNKLERCTVEEWRARTKAAGIQRASVKIDLKLEISPGNGTWLCFCEDAGLVVHADTPKQAEKEFMALIGKGVLQVDKQEAMVTPVVLTPVVATVEISQEAIELSKLPVEEVSEKLETPAPKKRGRPKKVQPVAEETEDESSFDFEAA